MEVRINMLTAAIVLLVLVAILLIKTIYLYNRIVESQKKSEKAIEEYIALRLKSRRKYRLK